VPFCVEMGKLGWLGVINLEGIQTRYHNPGEALKKIHTASKEDVTTIIQQIYTEPIKED
jgi:IMP dehydrogenase